MDSKEAVRHANSEAGQFIVSARKYRPVNFKDVISQSHITTTIKNALAYNQLAHAFLFCGPRGVGKTTCARILAKAANCMQLTEAIEPCDQCTNCLSFTNNRAINVYELDAASHNSVEDIRELTEQVRYAPQGGRYKVYIIDEVHMLSNAAFNAFLKTLEEPPSYALFILATTERNKVLSTILSRCQVFNFNRIKYEDMVNHLQAIAVKESIDYEISALQLIAQKAEGAMRDALSMFDLITAATGKTATITYATVCDHLQLLDYDFYFQCTEACLQGNIPQLLSLYDSILRIGFQGHHFIAGLGEHFRNLLVCQDPATIPLLEVTDHIRPKYAAYATQCTSSFLLRVLTLLNQYDINYKTSYHQRLHVELLLIELTTLTDEIAHRTTIASSNEIEPLDENKSALPKPKTPSIPTLKNLKHQLVEQVYQPLQRKAETTEMQNQQLLSQEMVRNCWTNYREKLKQEGHMAAYHLINQPINIQNHVITITLINPIQVDILQRIKKKLLALLRQVWHDADEKIVIQGILVEQTVRKKPYTNGEKLNFLSKKNRSIALLQEKFSLEFAY